jgi:hypothetical protein
VWTAEIIAVATSGSSRRGGRKPHSQAAIPLALGKRREREEGGVSEAGVDKHDPTGVRVYKRIR